MRLEVNVDDFDDPKDFINIKWPVFFVYFTKMTTFILLDKRRTLTSIIIISTLI